MSDVERIYVREINLILDNDEVATERVREVVMNAVRGECGYSDMTPDVYDLLHRDRAHELRGSVGCAVHYLLLDFVEEQATGIAADLLKQLVSNLEETLGESYLPHPDDYRDWYASQD